jgi:hypothetical protein
MALLSATLWSGSGLWWVRTAMFALGLAVGQVFVATQAAAFAGLSQNTSARAAALFNLGRRVGGAVGVAVATTVMSLASGAPYRSAMLVAAAVCLASGLLVLRVRDADAASTLTRHR